MVKLDNKNTLVLGASVNPLRYSFKATKKLIENKIKVYLVGKKGGEVNGINIKNKFPIDEKIDTISIYLKPSNQSDHIESIINLSPKRVIFNPGTENPSLFSYFSSKGIMCENSCTLVLLSTDQY
tara:strand:+ start:1288 stop:1662 length:375 start_codon:yes stop_codon:yes gene_type:complete